ncbi:MAG: NADH-ubiquinone oxidoreductase-F iron-sulfur binding region domain-containing protein [Parcubacteria group bacterium]|jgi:NADH:ubiquinone oxidoreductase subunit F (NADH-binding)
MNIIQKIKDAKLTGRGGAGFPTWQKWEAVKNAPGEKKYIIVNGSEGEPGVLKDGFILENYPEELINGVKVALETFENSEAYIYLRKDYYDKYKSKLVELSRDFSITLTREPGGYLCGEESTLIESIEGNRFEPRDKPPFPTEKGLFGMPTLVNNLETFYWISKIAKDEYHSNRFYSLSGDIANPGVFEFSEDLSIEKILKETNNFPEKEFFVQVGGGASGIILTREELENKVTGAGAIIVYDKEKTDPKALMKKWIDFYFNENCGKCVPCREGVYRIKELLENDNLDLEKLKDIVFVLEETSFCPLGKGVAMPFEGFLGKIY